MGVFYTRARSSFIDLKSNPHIIYARAVHQKCEPLSFSR